MYILLLIFALVGTPTEYNGIYISMDGCQPCNQLHQETEADILKYVEHTTSININHFKDAKEKSLANYYEATICPTFLMFKKVATKNVYVGRIEGYMPAKEFFESVEEIKSHAEKYKTEIIIRKIE